MLNATCPSESALGGALSLLATLAREAGQSCELGLGAGSCRLVASSCSAPTASPSTMAGGDLPGLRTPEDSGAAVKVQASAPDSRGLLASFSSAR